MVTRIVLRYKVSQDAKVMREVRKLLTNLSKRRVIQKPAHRDVVTSRT